MAVNDVEIYRGDSATLECHVTDEDGVDYDLTAHDVVFTIKEYEDSTDILLEKETGGLGVTLTDPLHGIMQVAVDAGDTDDIDGKKVYDIQITTPAGDVYTVTKAALTILKDVSF